MKPAEAISEKEWQTQVVTLAAMLGWRAMHVYPLMGKQRTHRTPTTVAGWPDLLLWNVKRPECGLVALELKSATGTATPEQIIVLAELEAAGVRTMIARPADLDEVHSLLAAR